MRTRVRAPLAAAPPPSQVAIEPDAPQRPLGAGRGAIADLLLAALHLPQRPIGTAERGRKTTGLRFSGFAMARRVAGRADRARSNAAGPLATCPAPPSRRSAPPRVV